MSLKLFTHALLFDCTGSEPQDDAWVVTEEGTIRETGFGTPPALMHAERFDCRGLTLMPGLIDAHIHLSLFDNNFCELHRNDYPAMHYVKALNVLEDTLQQGFTTARDAGGVDAGFRVAVERGLVAGPRLQVCGKSISQSGGHADMRYSTEQNPPAVSPFAAVIADGVAEVQKASREQLRQGVDYLKIMAGGGCASEADEPDTTQYTPQEISAIVYEASAVGKKTLAHCYSNNSIRMCAENGVFSIEHGNSLNAGTAKLLKEHDCWLVPTLTTYFYMSEHGEAIGLPPYFLRKMKQVRESALEAVQNAVDAGVRIGSGSDVVGSGQPHKNMEIALKAKVMGPMGAILSATRENAILMGIADRVGTVEPGRDADLILVAGNPTADAHAFEDRENLKLILQRGVLHKNAL